MSQTGLNFPLTPAVERVLASLRAEGGRPLVVGGCVRDALMGLAPEDTDIEVYGLDVDALKRILAKHGKVVAVGVSFGVLKVRLPGLLELDLALPRRESRRGERGFVGELDPTMTPAEGATRRDFTINAMAFDPATGELLDYFDGQGDLANGLLRHVGPAFAEDPLRVLRGMQFAARWNFEMVAQTAALCESLRTEYPNLAKERIWGEWQKLTEKGRWPAKGLQTLAQCGWRSLYPPLEGLAQRLPDEAAWAHTLAVVEKMAALCQRDKVRGEGRAVALLSALCHDLVDPSGGAPSISKTQDFLQRIGCWQDLTRRVEPLVREYLVYREGGQLAATPTTVRRLAHRLAPASIEQWERLVEAASDERVGLPWLELARELGCASGPLAPILLGRHLEEAGLVPGPLFGRLLRAAYEVQLDRGFASLDEAKSWLAQQLQEQIAE